MTDASAPFDVVGLGNAIVDVVVQTDDSTLDALGLTKGATTLIDSDRAAAIRPYMEGGIEMSGGSAANTVAGLASLGGRGAFLGRVGGDELGRTFRDAITAIGVEYRSPPAPGGPETARCLVLVTPDAERTMLTFLGVSTAFGPDDVDPGLIENAAIVYLEGYLFDEERAKAAFVRAAELAHAAGRRVALSLSDPFCVERHRAAFRHLVHGHVDILFANEAEIAGLYEAGDFDEACRRAAADCPFAALTRGAAGSVIATGGEIVRVGAAPVGKVVDTTGAGDLYAAGVLFGLSRGYEPDLCGRIGAIAAAEIVGHYGARPQARLADLLPTA
ncbi:MAG: adenosine kinase [Defluviicoccus sp.]|nr:adenosine kinase [Defluviicoccus sp.]MDE0277474.1 adenosine kinase [Defluviicoccus sp.]